MSYSEKQITHGPGGRILTHTGVWSPDSEWIVYDTRSDPAGEVFDGQRIEIVHHRTGETRVVYTARNGAHCGVATWHPCHPKIVFLLGPEYPTPDWSYNAWHRQGVVVEVDLTRPNPLPTVCWPGQQSTASSPMTPSYFLDARDLTPPYTPGALRGGSHVHVWDADGDWVSFTYEDHVLAQLISPGHDHEPNQRNIGISVPCAKEARAGSAAPTGPCLRVKKDHPRNHDGEFFSVLVTRTTARPQAGSDEISRAFEEGWVGLRGYVRPDGSRQRRALAFQGQVNGSGGEPVSEVFLVDLPEDVTVAGNGPLEGTLMQMPQPPKGTKQRRLTHTTDRLFPGLQGPRHWLHSSPDGEHIAFLMKDEAGRAQIWTISPHGGPPRAITHNPWPIASAFTWSPDGRFLAHVMDNSVCLTELASGITTRLTSRSEDAMAPRPESCVFSPDGKQIAFVRRVLSERGWHNQIFMVEMPPHFTASNDISTPTAK